MTGLRQASVRILAGATLLLTVALGAGVSHATAPAAKPAGRYYVRFEAVR